MVAMASVKAVVAKCGICGSGEHNVYWFYGNMFICIDCLEKQESGDG